jgi:hypothetical protein
MTLNDLYNPQNIIGFLHKNGQYFEIGKNQAIQEWPGSIELWQDMKNGTIQRVQRWLKKSIIAYY